ncbi:MAG: hypothetical protein JHC22_00135 [Thermoproteus sp.]|nr:hypothetical protein [Thermoproteus sp.]
MTVPARLVAIASLAVVTFILHNAYVASATIKPYGDVLIVAHNVTVVNATCPTQCVRQVGSVYVAVLHNGYAEVRDGLVLGIYQPIKN